jgi:hypothetical protein
LLSEKTTKKKRRAMLLNPYKIKTPLNAREKREVMLTSS